MAEIKEQEAQEEETKKLVPLTEEQKQEEQQIERWYHRMERYPVPLPDKVRYMAARMAVAYGLDPFLGEMVFIEQWKNKKFVGYTPYVGIGGLRRAARRTGEYGGRKLRPCTEEERNALQIDEDVHAWYCEVWRKGIDRPFDGFGVFPISDWDKKSTAPHWRMARKRAEHAALRAAFDLELQLMEVNGLVVEEKPVEAEVTELPAESLEEATEQAKAMFDEAQRKAEEIIQKGLEKQDEPLDLKAAITTGHSEEAPSPPTSAQLLDEALSKELAEDQPVEEEPLGSFAPPQEEEPSPPTAEQVIEEASEALGEILDEAKEPQGAEGLWAYAEAKGIDISIVKTVLEETGGEVEETLARLKEKYGEVE